MQTTKYGIIWSENVHFVTNLTVTGTGGLYPRVRDFLTTHVNFHLDRICKNNTCRGVWGLGCLWGIVSAVVGC